MPTGALFRSGAALAVVAMMGWFAGCFRHDRTTASEHMISAATRTVNTISNDPDGGFPDAVTNLTKCVLVIPSVPGGTALVVASGVAACRDQRGGWSKFSQVGFEGHSNRPKASDLLIFILTDGGVRAFHAGKLRLTATKSRSAPLLHSTPIPNQLELEHDWFAYQVSTGAARASLASGNIHRAGDDIGLSGHKDERVRAYVAALEGLFNLITPTGIVIHHTAVIPTSDSVPKNESEVDDYHHLRGFAISCLGQTYHVAYHYLILPNGNVQKGRPERCHGAHARGYNSYLGISVVGDFSSRDNPIGKKGFGSPTTAQLDSLLKLCLQLQQRYHIPLQHIVRHSDIASTQCPGDRFPFRSFLAALEHKASMVAMNR
jgi:N-acetylmuramoyl-L-alanine amidase